MEQILNYAPLALALIMFFMNYKIFVTPADLERKHRDIVKEINPEKGPAPCSNRSECDIIFTNVSRCDRRTLIN